MAQVKDIMTTTVFTATLNNTLRDALTLMRTHQVRHIPIINHNNDQLVGLLSERELAGLASFTEWFDLGREAYDAFLDRSIADAMPRRFFQEGGVITATDSMPVPKAIDLLLENKLSTLPVVADDDATQLTGILSYIDILHATRQTLS